MPNFNSGECNIYREEGAASKIDFCVSNVETKLSRFHLDPMMERRMIILSLQKSQRMALSLFPSRRSEDPNIREVTNIYALMRNRG